MAGEARLSQAANIEGLGSASTAYAQVLAAAGIGGKLGMADGVQLALNRVRLLLSEPGRGRTYKISGQRTLHRASAPGDPPAVLFGQLRSSYRWGQGSDALGDYAEIGTNQAKAPHLEFGTRFMRARPHLRVAVEQSIAQISAAVAAGIILAERGAVHRLPSEVQATHRLRGI